MDKLNPIGIFDSGIGGLTVAHAINKALPKEQIIYFGDTQHLPYGNKSNKKIKSYSNQITNFLLEKDCKAIIIGCNSASAIAFEYIKKKVSANTLIINVIDPVVNYIQHDLSINHVGIIGTNATIESNAYARKILKKRKNLSISCLATPLLASLIEENNPNLYQNGIIETYLLDKKLANIDSLILGCTHYPLIETQINACFRDQIKLISAVNIIGGEVKKKLKKLNLLNPSNNNLKHIFYVSDFTKNFQEKTKLFFPRSIILQEENIFS